MNKKFKRTASRAESGDVHAQYELAVRYATGNGVVTFSGWGTGYGRYVEIDHGNGTMTRYAHTSANYVSVGDTVSANRLLVR